jgi:signal transduction histidine kinase
MKIFIGLMLMLLIQKETFAQTTLKPSSSKNINAGSSVQNTVDHLNDVAFSIYLESPDSARSIAENALFQSEKSKYSAGIGRSFLNIGYVYWSQSYYHIALFYLKKALNNLPENKPLFIADCYNTFGRTYADLGDYKEAFDNLDYAERFANSDPDRLAETQSERSYICVHLKNFAEATKYANYALSLDKIAKDQSNTAVLYARLSDIYTKTKKYNAALAYSDTAYQMGIKTRNNRLRANTFIEYALIYQQLHNFDKAITYAKKGAALADSIGVVDAISLAYKTLIDTYEQKNDFKQAVFSQKEYNRIQDSLNTLDKTKNTALIKDYFTLNARLNDMALIEHNSLEIKAKIKLQRIIIITLGISLFIVIAVLSVTYYFYKQKELFSNKLNKQHDALLKQKQMIEAQTANLEIVNNIKDKLLAVIGHDLRSPLANLHNIIEMFEVEYISTEEVNWLMKDISPLVKSAELTLANLMDWAGNNIKGRSINSSRLDIFLLGVEMEQTFNHALQRKNIEFVNLASPGQSVLADENHIKVVLRNLISNAIKFTDTNGCIKLDSKYEESKVIISIEDNGKGMSAEEITMLFYLQTHFSQPGTLGEKGTGIGLLLCKELVELNGGKLWIDSEPGKGSKFSFSLPLNAEYA